MSQAAIYLHWYLHWAATPYTWVRSGLCHSIINGEGHVHRLHAYSVDLPAHTWRRNSNAVALSCACMDGRPDPWLIPPTAPQLESLCQAAASLARHWGWSAADITIQRLMTHAAAASNRDGRILHDNYGPVILRGILRHDRAWCRVLEFAEAFGISTSFEPFGRGERRGG